MVQQDPERPSDAVDPTLPFITWRVIDCTLALLRECRSRGAPEPAVLPDSNGGIRLLWPGQVEVELLNGGRMVLAGEMVEIGCGGMFDAAGVLDSIAA